MSVDVLICFHPRGFIGFDQLVEKDLTCEDVNMAILKILESL